MKNLDQYQKDNLQVYLSIALAIVVVIGVVAAGWPQYRVWQRELAGKGALREAEWNTQIKVEEAKANLEAQKLNAQAEVERAKGVAEANAIIGESLKDNDAYLRYLWIQGLHDGSSETIYIPTEANLPILEASRMTQKQAAT